MIRSGKKN